MFVRGGVSGCGVSWVRCFLSAVFLVLRSGLAGWVVLFSVAAAVFVCDPGFCCVFKRYFGAKKKPARGFF